MNTQFLCAANFYHLDNVDVGSSQSPAQNPRPETLLVACGSAADVFMHGGQ